MKLKYRKQTSMIIIRIINFIPADDLPPPMSEQYTIHVSN